MASVAKWLRQRIVVPPFVGSSPIVRPYERKIFACLSQRLRAKILLFSLLALS